MERPVRKRNRLIYYDYSQNGAYFVTLCTENRACIFSKVVGATIGRPAHVRLSTVGSIVEHAIRRIPEIYPSVKVDHYVIMPNHIHLLLSIAVPYGRPVVAPTISTVVQQLKGYIAKQTRKGLFQKTFHDHVIRNQRDHDMIWQYIDTNPARWERDCFYTED